jgi:hypothetical protein
MFSSPRKYFSVAMSSSRQISGLKENTPGKKLENRSS